MKFKKMTRMLSSMKASMKASADAECVHKCQSAGKYTLLNFRNSKIWTSQHIWLSQAPNAYVDYKLSNNTYISSPPQSLSSVKTVHFPVQPNTVSGWFGRRPAGFLRGLKCRCDDYAYFSPTDILSAALSPCKKCNNVIKRD